MFIHDTQYIVNRTVHLQPFSDNNTSSIVVGSKAYLTLHCVYYYCIITLFTMASYGQLSLLHIARWFQRNYYSFWLLMRKQAMKQPDLNGYKFDMRVVSGLNSQFDTCHMTSVVTHYVLQTQ